MRSLEAIATRELTRARDLEQKIERLKELLVESGVDIKIARSYVYRERVNTIKSFHQLAPNPRDAMWKAKSIAKVWMKPEDGRTIQPWDKLVEALYVAWARAAEKKEQLKKQENLDILCQKLKVDIGLEVTIKNSFINVSVPPNLIPPE